MANKNRLLNWSILPVLSWLVICWWDAGQGQPPPSSSMRQSIAKMADGWGVGQIEIPVGQIAPDATVRVVVRERGDRVLYPATEIFSADPGPATPIPGQPMPGQRTNGRAIGGGALVKRLRGALDRLRQHIDPEEYVRIHFLFTGNEPLHIELEGDLEMSMVLDPNQSETSASQEHMLQAWWQGYVQQTQRQIERSDYPTLIERYLVHMLGRRFGFQTPDLLNVKSKKRVRQTDPRPTLSLIAGVESLRDEISEQLWIEPLAPSAPRQQLPSPPRWLDHPVPDIPDDISIESIAQVVPEDFFYIRFGSFANFLWFQRIGESRGGDIAQLAMLRGFNYESSARVERVLNTRMTAVSKLFGDSVISDMAIVGYDLYMQEGPSMGIIFEAKNFGVLKASMEQERQATLRRLESAGCRLETVDIDGRMVSLLSTPDHQIRSYMVEAEPYLFLTTSKTLASRFLEVQQSKASLSNNLAFRFARWMMPMENRYDMFAYFSSEFFHNLLSPRYQIELQRRMLAIAAIETVELAAMVDASEQRRGFAGRNLQGRSKRESSQAEELRVPQSASKDIDRWIAKGYLPEWFQRRADGSETLRYADGWIDSARGKRGCFLPIADTPVDDCSTEEAAAYEMASEFYANQWQETDPLMFGLRRFAHPELPRAERLAIEAYVAPLGSEKYGALGILLAPPVPTQVIMPPDDVVNVQLRLSGIQTDRVFAEDHFLFAGLKDLVPPLPEETKGLLAILRLMRSLPAYIGSWPKPGYLDRLPLGLGGGPPDVLGFSRSLFGLWRWQMGGFSVISFDRSILESAAMHLQLAPAEDYAQGRLRVRDLSRSQVASLFHTLGFRQAAQTTRGNLLLLDSMQEQLGVEPEQAKAQAESLLDARLQCTLGGEYQYVDDRWITTAWPKTIQLAPNVQPSSIGFDSLHTVAPEGYQAPWLQWFRGAQLHLTQLPERLVVIGELDMEPLPPVKNGNGAAEATNGSLPSLNFDLYNLPFQFFQKDKPTPDTKGGTESNSEPNAAPKSRRKF